MAVPKTHPSSWRLAPKTCRNPETRAVSVGAAGGRDQPAISDGAELCLAFLHTCLSVPVGCARTRICDLSPRRTAPEWFSWPDRQLMFIYTHSGKP